MKRAILLALLVPGVARATECGELRAEAARLKAAPEARKQLPAVEKKLQAACAPKRATIAALPLGYAPMPPGNLSKATVDVAELGLQLTTQAGAASGVVFHDPAAIDGAPLRIETELSPSRSGGDLLVAFVENAQLTVEEPQAGRGAWRIDLRAKPTLAALSKIKACAAGKEPLGKLSKESCQMLARVDPVPQAASLPERGRAVFVGEWQYGWKAGHELGAEELGDGRADGPQPRVDLPLELSAPLPGISDGKKLWVTVGESRRERPEGAQVKLGHGCGDDDEACEKQRFGVEVWWDRAFGVPFLRPVSTQPTTRVVGKVTDRLARPVVGQRLLVTQGDRRVVTISDAYGDWRADWLGAGEMIVQPVGRRLSNVLKGDEVRRLGLGLGETKAPVIFVGKLHE